MYPHYTTVTHTFPAQAQLKCTTPDVSRTHFDRSRRTKNFHLPDPAHHVLEQSVPHQPKVLSRVLKSLSFLLRVVASHPLPNPDAPHQTKDTVFGTTRK
jgi:hypothetical protein